MANYYPTIRQINLPPEKLIDITETATSISANRKQVLVTTDKGTIHRVESRTHTTYETETPIYASTYFNKSFYVGTTNGISRVTKRIESAVSIKATCLVLGHTTEHLISGWDDGVVRIFNKEFECVKELPAKDVVAVACAGTIIAIATKDLVKVYDVQHDKDLTSLYFLHGKVDLTGSPESISIKSDGSTLAIGTSLGRCTIVPVNKNKLTFFAHCNRAENTSFRVTGVHFQSESFVLTCGMDGAIGLWNYEKKTVVGANVIEGVTAITSSAVSDTRHYFTALANGKLSLYVESVSKLFGMNTRKNPTPVTRRDSTKSTSTNTKSSITTKSERKSITKKRKTVWEEEEHINDPDPILDTPETSEQEEEEGAVHIKRTVTRPRGESGLMVCLTGFTQKELRLIKEEIHDKQFFLVSRVIEASDVVVTAHGTRTLDVLNSIVLNKPVVSEKWVLDSQNEKKVLPVEDYLLIKEFPALASHPFDTTLLHDQRIAVWGKPKIRREPAERLIRALGGTVAERLKSADIVVVGKDELRADVTRRTEGVPVREEWLYDCISFMKQLSLEDYIIEGEIKKEDLVERLAHPRISKIPRSVHPLRHKKRTKREKKEISVDGAENPTVVPDENEEQQDATLPDNETVEKTPSQPQNTQEKEPDNQNKDNPNTENQDKPAETKMEEVHVHEEQNDEKNEEKNDETKMEEETIVDPATRIDEVEEQPLEIEEERMIEDNPNPTTPLKEPTEEKPKEADTESVLTATTMQEEAPSSIPVVEPTPSMLDMVSTDKPATETKPEDIQVIH